MIGPAEGRKVHLGQPRPIQGLQSRAARVDRERFDEVHGGSVEASHGHEETIIPGRGSGQMS